MTDTTSIEYKRTQFAQCRLIKTNTIEQLIGSLEVEQPGHFHHRDIIVR